MRFWLYFKCFFIKIKSTFFIKKVCLVTICINPRLIKPEIYNNLFYDFKVILLKILIKLKVKYFIKYVKIIYIIKVFII